MIDLFGKQCVLMTMFNLFDIRSLVNDIYQLNTTSNMYHVSYIDSTVCFTLIVKAQWSQFIVSQSLGTNHCNSLQVLMETCLLHVYHMC